MTSRGGEGRYIRGVKRGKNALKMTVFGKNSSFMSKPSFAADLQSVWGGIGVTGGKRWWVVHDWVRVCTWNWAKRGRKLSKTIIGDQMTTPQCCWPPICVWSKQHQKCINSDSFEEKWFPGKLEMIHSTMYGIQGYLVNILSYKPYLCTYHKTGQKTCMGELYWQCKKYRIVKMSELKSYMSFICSSNQNTWTLQLHSKECGRKICKDN